MDGSGGWLACGTRPWGWSRIGKCSCIFRVRGDTLMSPDHTAFQVRSSGRVEPGLFGVPEKTLTTDATRKLLVHAAG